MKNCPHCKKEVEEYRGECPHCHEDLYAEGILERLDEQGSKQADAYKAIEELQKTADANDTRLKVIEDQMKARAERFQAIQDGDLERPQPVNIGNIIRALVQKDWSYCSERDRNIVTEEGENIRDLHAKAEGRALSTGAVATGGAIIPPEYMPQQMIDVLRAKIVCEQLGARTLTGLTGTPATIPRLAGTSTAYHVPENTGKTPSDQSFELLTLTPHEVAALTIASRRMVMMSNPSVDTLIQDDLLKVLARAIDFQALYGTGAGATPIGIINTVGVGTATVAADAGAGGLITAADIDTIELVLATNNADDGKIGWAVPPRTRQSFMGMRTDSGAGAGTGPYFFRDDLKAGNLDGYPLRATTQMPINEVKGAGVTCSHLIHGNWDDLIIAYWGGLELATSDVAGDAFKYNQVYIKAALLYDVGLRHPLSFVSVDGILN